VNADPYTSEDMARIYENEHPGRKLA